MKKIAKIFTMALALCLLLAAFTLVASANNEPEENTVDLKVNVSLSSNYRMNFYVPAAYENAEIVKKNDATVGLANKGLVELEDGTEYNVFTFEFGVADIEIYEFTLNYEENGTAKSYDISYGMPSYAAQIMNDTKQDFAAKNIIMNMVNYADKVLTLCGDAKTGTGAKVYSALLDFEKNPVNKQYVLGYLGLDNADFENGSDIYASEVANLVKNPNFVAQFQFATGESYFIFKNTTDTYTDAKFSIGDKLNLTADNSGNGIYACKAEDLSYRVFDLNKLISFAVYNGEELVSSSEYSLAAYINALLVNEAENVNYIDAAKALYAYASVADAYFNDEIVGHVHNTNGTIAAVAPTCTSTGLTEGHYCSDCGELIITAPQEILSMIPHTAVEDKAVAATCMSTGLTAGSHCSVCNQTIVAQEKTDKANHNAVADAAVTATCLSTGLTEGSHCSVCNQTLVAQELVEKTGHNEVTVEGHEATCFRVGLTDGKECSVCGVQTVPQTVIPKTDHVYVGGYCEHCGKEEQ